MEKNKIIQGDCLRVLKNFPQESIDLIYLDPPFFSQKDYDMPFSDKKSVAAFKDSTKAYEEMDVDNINKSLNIRLIHSDNDFWKRDEAGLLRYLAYMKDRLKECHRVLKKTGSIYVHCDWHASHYLKIVMDEIFGYGNFKNDITWKRTYSHNDPRQYGRNSDKILFYSKTDRYVWNTQYTDYEKSYIKNFFRYKDKRGIYRLVVLTGPKINPNDPTWKGYNPKQSKRSWSVPKRIINKLVGETEAKKLSITQKLDLLYKNDYIEISKNNIPNFKQYLDEMDGVPLQEIWTDIPNISSQSAERLGYPTQKQKHYWIE